MSLPPVIHHSSAPPPIDMYPSSRSPSARSVPSSSGSLGTSLDSDATGVSDSVRLTAPAAGPPVSPGPSSSSSPSGPSRPVTIPSPPIYAQPTPPFSPLATASTSRGQSSRSTDTARSDLYRMYKPREQPAPAPRASEPDQAMEVDPPSTSHSSSPITIRTPPLHFLAFSGFTTQETSRPMDRPRSPPRQPPPEVDHRASNPLGLFDHPYDFRHPVPTAGRNQVHSSDSSPAMSLPAWLSGVDTPVSSLQPQRTESSSSHGSRRFRFAEPEELERMMNVPRALREREERAAEGTPATQTHAPDPAPAPAPAPSTATAPAPPRSHESQQRMSLLDRIRLGDAPAETWNSWGSPWGGVWGTVPFRGPDTVSRLDRYPSGEPSPRDSRSRPSRRRGSNETLASDEGRPEIIRWHNDVQDALSRRSSDDRDAPQSPASSLRRHREITSTSERERPRSRQRLDDMDSPSVPVTFGFGHSRPWAPLWGELGEGSQERESRREETPLEQWYAAHHRPHATASTAPRMPGPYSPYDFPGANYHQRLVPSNPFKSIVFTPEMTDAERLKKIRGVARTVQYWPSRARKLAAESTLKRVNWGDMDTTDMPRDVSCSVCHDDYEVESEVCVTACKHMYHRHCLETWLDRPHTSSCPMCRRDMAILASIYKMMPGEANAAIPLWMAL